MDHDPHFITREQYAQADRDYLTLRDQFACAALTGLLAPGILDAEGTASLAYQYADAMLAARTLKKETP